jgi:hypothetical protein
MDQTEKARVTDEVDAPRDLVVRVRGHGLYEERHGPGVFEADYYS